MKRFLLFLTLVSCATVPKPPLRAPDWCRSVSAGPPAVDIELALSKAHASRRFFGVGERYSPADQALARALSRQAVGPNLDLHQYAESLPDTCWLETVNSSLPDQQIRWEGDVLWLKPGRGPRVEIGPKVQTVIIDLRDLPTVEGWKPILGTWLARLSISSWADRSVRVHYGMTDEFFTAHGVYSNAVETLVGERLPVSSNPFVGKVEVLLGPTLPPEVAEFAGILALSGRAQLAGADLLSGVAESIWLPLGPGGLAFRVRDLLWDGHRWPDVIAAGNLRRGRGAALRTAIGSVHPFQDVQPRQNAIGDTRAALVIAHGALRLFFPDFTELGDRIDSRLHETLKTADGWDEAPSIGQDRDLLRRFNEALHDGHSFIFSQPPDPRILGYMAMMLETLHGRPVVRRSAVPGLEVGDTILAIAGHTTEQFYKEQLPLTSASTPGYRYDIANRELAKLSGPTPVRVRAVNGNQKTIIVYPQSRAELVAVNPSTPILRLSGWLTDLGIKDIYYLNLSDTALKNSEDLKKNLLAAQAARAMIADLRGYPGMDVYEIAKRLICHPFASPTFRYIVYTEPAVRTTKESHYDFEALPGPQFCGPLAILVGPHTVSAAESLATTLVDAKRVRVFGASRSAASNGNIPGIQLPGSLALTFSGMEILHSDGSPFAGEGIVPEVNTPLTPRDLKRGRDPVLELAAKKIR